MRLHLLRFILLSTSTLLCAQGTVLPPHHPSRTPNTVAIEAQVEPWVEGETFVESKGLPLDTATPFFENGPAAPSTGYHVLNIAVQPGEKIKLKMKSEEDKVSMRAFIPEPPPVFAWRVALNQANSRFVNLFRPRMEFQNTTNVPQTLGLIIFGHHGYKYRVDLERIPAPKKD